MKKAILFFAIALAFGQTVKADQLVRSKLHEYMQYSTDNVKPYDKQRVLDENKKTEDAEVTAAVTELRQQCKSNQKLDITKSDPKPNTIMVGQDQKMSLVLIGICLDMMTF